MARLNGSDQLRVQHVEGTVAAHSVNFLIRAGDLSAQSGCNLVAHAGVAVLHVVGVLLACAPQTLHVARQRACCCTYDRVVVDHVVNGAQNSGLAQLAAGILDVLLNALAVSVVDLRGEVLLVGVLNSVQTLNLGPPLLTQSSNLLSVSLVGVVADLSQLLADSSQSLVCVSNDRSSVHLVSLELRRVDVDELSVGAVQPLGSGGEVGVTGTNADYNVSLVRQLVCSDAAGGAQTAEVQLVIPNNSGLAGLGLAECDAEVLSELLEYLVCLSVTNAAAADQERLLCVLDDLNSLVESILGDRTAVNAPYALLEEVNRVIVCFSLNVLRQRNCNSTGVSGIGQNTHSGDHVGHNLLRTVDAAPVLGNSLESIMSGDGQVLRLLHLLENRVRLTGSVDVARQDQNRNVVSGSGCSSGNHVAGAGAYGRGAGEDGLAAHLLSIANCSQSHALLVLALIYDHVLELLLNAVSEANYVAVARQHEDALNELVLLLVAIHINVADILVLEEANECLRRSQTNGFHMNHVGNPPK